MKSILLFHLLVRQSKLYHQTRQLSLESEGAHTKMNLTMKLSKRLSFGEEVKCCYPCCSVLTLILLPLSAIYSYEVHGLL